MAKQFKDFNKEAKDLLTKNFPAPGSWKVETKDKAADRTWTVNPIAEAGAKSSLAVDVDYNMKEYALKTKTNFNANGTVKPKVTYEAGGHKVETTLSKLAADADFEIVYEGNLAGALVTDKVTKKAADVSFSYPVGPVVVGASVAYGFSKGLQSWSAGARFVEPWIVASVVTKEAKTWSTGVYAPIDVAGVKAKVAAQTDCGHGKFDLVVGVEAPFTVPVCGCSATARVKVDKGLGVAVSVIHKVANSWTAVLSMKLDDCCKFGVQLTRE